MKNLYMYAIDVVWISFEKKKKKNVCDVKGSTCKKVFCRK